MMAGIDWLVNGFKSLDAKDWGNILSGGASAYGALKQGAVADNFLKLQTQAYKDEKKRKKKFQERLDLSAEKNLGQTHKYDSLALPLV